jgi:hypothetical protein
MTAPMDDAELGRLLTLLDTSAITLDFVRKNIFKYKIQIPRTLREFVN